MVVQRRVPGHHHVVGGRTGWRWFCCDGKGKVRTAGLAIVCLLVLQYCVSMVVTGRHGGMYLTHFLGNYATRGDREWNGSSARRLLSQSAFLRRVRLFQMSGWTNTSERKATSGLSRLPPNVSARSSPGLLISMSTVGSVRTSQHRPVKAAKHPLHNAPRRLSGLSAYSSIGTTEGLSGGRKHVESPPEQGDNADNEISKLELHVRNKNQSNANTAPRKYVNHSSGPSTGVSDIKHKTQKSFPPSPGAWGVSLKPDNIPHDISKHKHTETSEEEEEEEEPILPKPTKSPFNPRYDLVIPFDEVNRSSGALPNLPPGAPPYCPVVPPGLNSLTINPTSWGAERFPYIEMKERWDLTLVGFIIVNADPLKKYNMAIILDCKSKWKRKDLCFEGLISVSYSRPSFEELEDDHPEVRHGGKWHPPDCTARNKVAIIIPYRDRDDHLRVFLHHMHPFLQKQQLDYGIYVVEMAYPTKFNRAMLFNIGFVEARKDYDWQCYVFHDVDLLPEEDHNLYSCPHNPRHMSAAIDTMAYRLPYATIMGGVVAIRKEQYEQVNGFSNMFFGWGAEDDDFYNRVRHHGLRLTRYPMRIARYRMLRHFKSKASDDRFKYLKTGEHRFETEGLNSLQYKLLQIIHRKLFTWVYVEVDQEKVQSMFIDSEEDKGHVPEGLLDPMDRTPEGQTKHWDYSHTKKRTGKKGPMLSEEEIEVRALRKAYLEQIHQQLQEELKREYEKKHGPLGER